MSAQFPPLFIPNTIIRLWLEAIFGGFNPFPAKHVHLFQGPVVFTDQTVLSDLLEADFDGYVEWTQFNWSTPFFDEDGTTIMVSTNARFVCTGNTHPNTIGGWYLTDAADTTFVYGQNFNPLKPISEAGQAVNVQPYFRWPSIL